MPNLFYNDQLTKLVIQYLYLSKKRDNNNRSTLTIQV